MTPACLDWSYSMHLDGMVQAKVANEDLRALAAMARETARRSGAELALPADGTRLWIWSDLHFDDERIWWNAKRPFPSLREMNEGLRARWREAVADGDTVVCAGDLGGSRTAFGRWKPPCVNLPGRKVVVLGNHDFTWFRWRERPLGADASSMTLLIRSDPSLLVTHVPLIAVPDGCVNVHGSPPQLPAPGARSVDQRERRADRLPAA
ncbi:MAG: metallophosphoesterase [Acidobacteria bacterium]|nr:metallophosphoesterase [Acidobacteriota bacterium]